MILDLDAFLTGALHFGLAFLAAGSFMLIFKALYRLITPHDEGKLIREGNVAAAITLGGAIFGFIIPLTSALSNTESLPEFVIWALLAGVIQVLAFWGVRTIAMPDISARIDRGEIAAALYMATMSVAVGLLNAACMTA